MTKDAKDIHQEQKETALLLKEVQEKKALISAQFQKKAAADLKKDQTEIAAGHLECGDVEEGVAAIICESNQQAATILENAQSKAAMLLKQAHADAAVILKETHVKAAEKHEEKDQIISWLAGSYSAPKSD